MKNALASRQGLKEDQATANKEYDAIMEYLCMAGCRADFADLAADHQRRT